MIDYSKITLKNKLDVYTFPVSKSNNVISVDIFYKVGSRNKIMGRSGIAHILKHLGFKNTRSLKAGGLGKIVRGFDGVDNANTGFDYTHYYIRCSKKNLDKTLELSAELMEDLSLKGEGFRPERSVVLEEHRWRTDNNPLGYLYLGLFNYASMYHPYHWTPIGFFKDTKNWSIEDTKGFHGTYYQPKNVISIVGEGIDSEEVFSGAKKHFEKIKNTKPIPKIHTKEPKQDGAKRIETKKPTQTELLAVGFRISNFKHEDIPALNALAEFLENGRSSMMNEILVDRLNLVNELYSFANDYVDENLFIFICDYSVGVRAEKVKQELWKIIDRLKKGDFSNKDLQEVENSVKGDFVFSLDTASAVSNTYGSYLARGDLRPLLECGSNMAHLCEQGLVKSAKKYFDRSDSTTLILRKD